MVKTTAARQKRTATTPAPVAPGGAEPQDKNGKKTGQKDGVRETVESIVVAFILAFLFRTFEAEAFVIPTGSMAPTLHGRHKELVCDQCGLTYAIGASDEVDKDGLLVNRIQTAFCPNCRYQMFVENEPVFKGDRILVNKFPYEIGEPDRWEVVVFKYPEEPQTNYIKRLIGLPGETLQIQQGDVYAKRDGQWRILRKDEPAKQRLLQQLVYDNDYPERALYAHGWPERWAAVQKSDADGNIAGWIDDTDGWTADTDDRSFQLSNDQPADGRWRWIRYRHIVPTRSDWEAVTENPPALPTANPRPELISDFCGYNAYTGGSPIDRGYFWVGDLTLNCEVEVTDAADGGELLLELNEGARRYRCRFNFQTGEAVLSHTIGFAREEGVEEEKRLASANTKLAGPGTYRLSFANVDDRLSLWVDDKLVDFGPAAEYEPYGGLRMQSPQEKDLIPAGIAARGASLRVAHLKLERDIYYRNEFVHPRDELHNGNGETVREYDGYEERLHELLDDPQAWYREYESKLSRHLEEYEDVSFQFELGPDEFFMMGDNSPRSKDSRLWSNVRRAYHRHAVPRSALVGKAFFIYWPHAVPFLNDGDAYPVRYHYERDIGPDGHAYLRPTDYPSFRVPFYPHVTRMRRIR